MEQALGMIDISICLFHDIILADRSEARWWMEDENEEVLIMAEEKNFTLDKYTLEGQLDKLKDMIEDKKKVMAENKAIALDPSHAFDEQGEWAKARNDGIEEGINRNQQQYAETEERLRRLSDESQDK